MSNFTRSKNNLELKLLLMNTLENFDANLASSLNKSIISLTDTDIVEMIIDIKNTEDDEKVIATVLQKLIKKENSLKDEIDSILGGAFLEKYLNK